MAVARSEKRKILLRTFLAMAILFSSIHCTLFERRPRPSREPLPAEPTRPQEANIEPAPSQKPITSPRKVGIILGPGGAKAFAHAGVLKELQKARIPISQVVGMEWGALVGALFSQTGQAHEMEWKLYKLEKYPTPTTGFLSGKIKPGTIKDLAPFFEEAFAQSQIENSTVDFACTYQRLNEGEVRWQDRGSFAKSLGPCLSLPPLYKGEIGMYAAPTAIAEAVERLKNHGADVIIVVNVLSRGRLINLSQLSDPDEPAIFWQEVRRNFRANGLAIDEWIDVDTSGFMIGDFARRRDLVSAGERAGQRAARRLIDRFGF